MNRKRVIVIGLTLALSLVSLSFKCDGGGNGQVSDPQRKAAKAADDIAGSIKAMISLKRQLAQSGKITPQEELNLTNILLKVNSADKIFVTRLKSLRATPDAATKSDLVRMFGEVTAALSDLNTSGIVSIGNADARTQLTNILNAINASVQVINAFLQANS